MTSRSENSKWAFKNLSEILNFLCPFIVLRILRVLNDPIKRSANTKKIYKPFREKLCDLGLGKDFLELASNSVIHERK